MDPRLQEASFSGDLHSLQQLLREDRLLLNRPTSYCSDTPLHVAAALGHADFAAEVLRLRPDLAFELGEGGHTPLHLAAANGHVAVVKVLLQLMLRNNNSNAAELCFLRDKDGLTPVHAAALKGRTGVLRELVGACPNVSVRDANGRGETALHLAVRSGSFEAVEFLVGDDASAAAAELLNSKDEKGNTALHLALATKQLQTVKFMLNKPSVDVNSANLRGLTPLDVLLECPNEQYGDMALDEMIRAAGGNTAAELELSPTVLLSRQRAIRRQKRVEEDDKYRNTPATLMVVATLIAAITFQTALNPPGGFNQNQDNGKSSSSSNEAPAPAGDSSLDYQRPGEVVLGKDLNTFLMFDVIGLFASMSIILLLICVAPRRKMLMRFLSWIMWVAVLSTALAFQSAIAKIYQSYVIINILFISWFGILNVAAVWICFRFVVFLLKRVGWWKGRGGGGGGGGLLLVVKRIGVVAAVLVAAGATVLLTIFVVMLAQD